VKMLKTHDLESMLRREEADQQPVFNIRHGDPWLPFRNLNGSRPIEFLTDDEMSKDPSPAACARKSCQFNKRKRSSMVAVETKNGCPTLVLALERTGGPSSGPAVN